MRKKTPRHTKFVPKWMLKCRGKRSSMQVFCLPPLPLLHLWNQANTKPSGPLEFLVELQLLALQQGLQNQVTTLTGSTLTARRADFANALPLLSCCCQMGGEQRSDGTGQMLPLTTSCLWPGSLQGALHSSLIDSKIFIYLFILCTQSLLQPAGLIHHHYLILSIFFLPFFFFFLSEKSYSQLVFMSTTAGSLWNLQAIQSMCQIEQDKVSNVTQNIHTCCLFPDFPIFNI